MSKDQRTVGKGTLTLEAPRFENHREMLIAGIRGHFTPSTWEAIPAQWERTASYREIPENIGKGDYFGLCFPMADGVDYMSGFAVSQSAGLPAALTCIKIPAQRYAIFVHRDHVSNLRQTLGAIWDHWVPESGYQTVQPGGDAPVHLERYGCPEFDPQTGYGDIEVWVPIKG